MSNHRDSHLDRRSALALAGGAAMAGFLRGSPAVAQSGELVVANWGGDWNERVVAALEKPYVEAKGIRIVHDLVPAPERKAKLLAERRLPRGSIDVAWLSDADAFEMYEQGVLEPLDPKMLPNLANVEEKFRLPYLGTVIFGGVVLMYNPNKIETPPTSFADLWNPKYTGRVGLMDQLYFNYIYAASVTNGGSMGDVSKAFPALLDLKKAVQPRLYPSHQTLAAAFQSEEVWISAEYSARIIQWTKEGLPVAWTYPEEGAILVSFGAGLPKRARNKDAAAFYLNEMLLPKPMGGIAEGTSYAVTNPKAEMSEETRKRLAFTPEQIAKFNVVDYPYAAKNDPKWVEWWNKEFKA